MTRPPALLGLLMAISVAGALGCGGADASRPPPGAADGRGAEDEGAGDAAAPRARRIEVRQPGTDLFWLRCPLGRTWSGHTCIGVPRGMNWKTAREACPRGYRLPTRWELMDLLGGCDEDARRGKAGWCAACDESETCGELFVDDEGLYWTSERRFLINAWVVAFHNGRVRWIDGQIQGIVRCVR